MVEERKQKYRKGSSSRARVPVQKAAFQWWRKGCSGKGSVTEVEEGYQCWRKGSSAVEEGWKGTSVVPALEKGFE